MYDGRPVQKALKDTKCIKNAISKQLVKLQQIDGMLLVLNQDCVNIVKVSGDEAQIVHRIDFERCEHVGILPGFDFENFPFIVRLHTYHTIDHKRFKEKECSDPDACVKSEWRAHHLRMT